MLVISLGDVLSLLLISLFVFGACSSTSSTAGEETAKVQTEAQAVAIALDYLKQQPFADEYVPETAEATKTESGWQVMVDHVDGENRRPSVGVISVNKATGKASWMPLR